MCVWEAACFGSSKSPAMISAPVQCGCACKLCLGVRRMVSWLYGKAKSKMEAVESKQLARLGCLRSNSHLFASRFFPTHSEDKSRATKIGTANTARMLNLGGGGA